MFLSWQHPFPSILSRVGHSCKRTINIYTSATAHRPGRAHVPRTDVCTDHVLDESVVRPVHVDRSVEGVVDSQPSDVRAAHVTVQVKMDRISTQTEGLSGVGNFDVAQANHRCLRVRLWRMGNNVNTKLVTSGLRAESSLETSLGRKLSCNKSKIPQSSRKRQTACDRNCSSQSHQTQDT